MPRTLEGINRKQQEANKRWREKNPEKWKESYTASNKRWREKNPEKRRACVYRAVKKRMGPNLDFLSDYKSNAGCCVCAIKDPVVLDFHHRDRKTKKFSVARGAFRSREELLLEIDKCVVLCANCHRRQRVGLITIPPPVESPL